MEDNPLISICIPIYNAVGFIEETVNCFINQTYTHWELILQDDCSTDGTYVKALTLANSDERIKVFRNNENLGIGKNWNECFKHVLGEFVVIANADDIYHNHFLENGIEVFRKNPSADSLSFAYEIYDEINLISSKIPYQTNLKEGFQVNLFELSFFHNPFHIIFSIFKKESLDNILVTKKLFLETQICDAELFFRIGKNNFKHFYSTYNAGKYRKHPNNNSLIPNGESNSWLFDVIPLYFNYLKHNYRNRSLKLFRNKITHEIKFSLIKKKKVNFRVIMTLMRYYIKLL
jgi:glycosyltransferase involved in cell wall biosynthesis